MSTGQQLRAALTGPTGGWKRRATILVLAVATAGGLALADSKPDTRTLTVQPIEIVARPIASFDKSTPEAARFGRLEWRGGVVLSSPSPHFGGWSGLTVDAQGRRFSAVSDAGTWISGELVYNGGQLAGMTSARLGPLLSMDRKPLRSRDRDAEALTVVEGTLQKGTALIAFEGNDRIGRFAIEGGALKGPASYLGLPAELKRVRSYDGIEAVTMVRGGPLKGAVVAFAEHLLPGQTARAGWIWSGAGEPGRFMVTDPGGFDITDAASLADGAILILERRFRWNEGVKARLRRLPAGEIKAGAELAGETLLEADLNQEIDNMEGLAVHTATNGDTILTLISDDNFNPLLQRTVMLQFALPARSLATR